jgi:dienelactone hydrolase
MTAPRRSRDATSLVLTIALGCGARAPAEDPVVGRSIPRGEPHGRPEGRAASTATSTPAAEPGAPRAPEDPQWIELPIEGFLPAVVVVPPGAAAPRPVVVVTHGAGGRPEPHCARYLEIVGRRAFLVCTRGREMDKALPPEERGYFYDGHKELGREVRSALAALRARFGARVAEGGAVFAGYSQGASMGLLFLHEKAEFAALFAAALFVEGGAADWNIALSRRMKESGLARVAIVCGQRSCHEDAKQAKRWIDEGGLEARLLHAPGAGHTYGGAVAPLVEEAFAWLVDGDARWAEPPKF